LRKLRPGEASVDPFVKSHRVSKNDNVAIDIVAQQWATIADATNCWIGAPSHRGVVAAGAIDADCIPVRRE
jgi:hypothetical protein